MALLVESALNRRLESHKPLSHEPGSERVSGVSEREEGQLAYSYDGALLQRLKHYSLVPEVRGFSKLHLQCKI